MPEVAMQKFSTDKGGLFSCGKLPPVVDKADEAKTVSALGA